MENFQDFDLNLNLRESSFSKTLEEKMIKIRNFRKKFVRFILDISLESLI